MSVSRPLTLKTELSFICLSVNTPVNLVSTPSSIVGMVAFEWELGISWAAARGANNKRASAREFFMRTPEENLSGLPSAYV